MPTRDPLLTGKYQRRRVRGLFDDVLRGESEGADLMRIIPECGRVEVTKELTPFVFQCGFYAGAKDTIRHSGMPQKDMNDIFEKLYDNWLKPVSAELRKVVGVNKAISFQVIPCEIIVFDIDPDELTYDNNEVARDGDKYVLNVKESEDD